MSLRDVIRFAWRSLEGYRTRTLLMVLAMSIGVAAVVVLTSLGEGARRYVRNEFESLGTNLIIVLPGRAETVGGLGGMVSGRTTHDMTIEDALALRRIAGVEHVAPLNLVEGEIWAKGRHRNVPVAGSTAEVKFIWGLTVASGRFLPSQDPRRGSNVCVLGSKVTRELFGASSPLGEWVRLADRRFRVIGVLAPKGEFAGVNMDELVFIPVASAQAAFNLHSLLRIGVRTKAREDIPRVKRQMREILRERHGGDDDVTILTEDAVSAA
ncbi:MAG TPA: ABC transporter permease, partial [Thermoanaerobaculia bacterium]|nr:ABC transporter permease [Thermoanaerobaculia bacterium]